jgi:hypothetical protein
MIAWTVGVASAWLHVAHATIISEKLNVKCLSAIQEVNSLVVDLTINEQD